jgi:methionine-rich copper-binding protein CopC
LKRAEPGVNDTIVASPKAIKLWFTESVGAASTSVRVTGPSDQTVAVGAVTVDEAPLSPAVVSVLATLAAGTYLVEWRAMAADGHPSGGKFSFVLRSAESR